MGRACSIPRCGHCLSENHAVGDCPDLPQGPNTRYRLIRPTSEPSRASTPDRRHRPQPHPQNTAGYLIKSGAGTCTYAVGVHCPTPSRCARTVARETDPHQHCPCIATAIGTLPPWLSPTRDLHPQTHVGASIDFGGNFSARGGVLCCCIGIHNYNHIEVQSC